MKPYFAFQWHITDECDQRCRHCYIFSENDHICLKQMDYEKMAGIIKYPFWQMTAANPKATYACINYGEVYVPEEIAKRSICINADIGEVLSPS